MAFRKFVVCFLALSSVGLNVGKKFGRRYGQHYKDDDSRYYYNYKSVYDTEQQQADYNYDYPRFNKVLRTFNVNLIRSVDHKLDSLSDTQKAQFQDDIWDMNAAITDEYNRIKLEMKAAMSDEYNRRKQKSKYKWRTYEYKDDKTSSSKEKNIGRAVVEKIITDYQSKPWYKRIKRFAGGRLKSLVRDLVHNLEE